MTFFSLPQDALKIWEEQGLERAREFMRARIGKFGNGIRFGEVWESGSWCMKFTEGI